MKAAVDRSGRQADERLSKGTELRTFLVLAVVLAPMLAVMIVGGYGFFVWMLQAVFGPPGS
jgi:periplasmic nitrate reductase NapE